ncbi:MAG: alpha/beta hydrolase, partial [Mycolicibacterium sp.]
MILPTVSMAQRWRPDALLQLAEGWDSAARALGADVDGAVADSDRSLDYWTGAAADAARERARGIAADTAEVARRLVTASVAARDGADQLAAARADVLAGLELAERDGLVVADDGSVTLADRPAP